MGRALRLTAAVAACALALSACGTDPGTSTPSPSSARDGSSAATPGAGEVPGETTPGADPSASPAETGVAGLPSSGSGIPGVGSSTAPERSSGPAFGVQVFAMWRDWELHEELMDDIVAAGSHWVRFDVGWCTLEEAGPGQISTWYLDRLDKVVAEAEERGLSMAITLTCSPTWARSDGRIKALPDDPQQYARVATYLASRYAGRVAAWEVWNEPDCLDVGCSNAPPADYVPLLKAGYQAIKAADPKTTVVSGGISGINLAWISELIKDGGGDYMDAMGVNPYLNPAKAPPDTRPSPGFIDRYRITNAQAAHELLVKQGYPDLPLWFTEFGWSTGRISRPRYDGVPPETQAAYLTQAVDLVRDRYPYVTHIFWFCLRDRDDATVNENGFGLLELDGTPKPSYAAFTAANQALANPS